MAVIYVFHIVSLYNRCGDGTAGTDMIDYNSKTALHDVTHRVDVCCILIMYNNIGCELEAKKQEQETETSDKVFDHC